jgi:histidine triad (HIT) family protein
MRQLSQLLFRLARSRIGGLVIGWGFAHMSYLMPLKKIHETDLIIAFEHPKPAHAIHILIVPKRNASSFMELTDKDIQHDIFSSAQYLIDKLGLAETGYRLIVNGGEYQDVRQLHFHLIADG